MAPRAVLLVGVIVVDRAVEVALDLAGHLRGRVTPRRAGAKTLVIAQRKPVVLDLRAKAALVQAPSQGSDLLELADLHALVIDPLAPASGQLELADLHALVIDPLAPASGQLELADLHALVIDPFAPASALLDPVAHLVQAVAQVTRAPATHVAREMSEPVVAILRPIHALLESVATCRRVGDR